MQQWTENISIDDKSLVRLCQQGDSDAMGRLIVKYQDRVYNTILKICGNTDDAAELTQETFVKVIEKINSFKGNSLFYTWLFRVAVNLTYNFCKRRAKQPKWSLDELTGSDFDDVRRQLRSYLADDNAVDPAMLAQRAEAGKLAMAALSGLDDSQRVMVVLRDIEGMSYSEIAETLKMELGTVKSRLSRARSTLKNILETVLK